MNTIARALKTIEEKHPERMAEVKRGLLGVKDENVEGQMDLFGDVA